MFEEPTLPVYLITKSPVVASLRARLRDRPWVDVVDAGEPVSLPAAMRYLRERGMRVISAIGGRRTATALLRDGLVSDIYLTTSPIEAGEPNTPFYEGPPLNLTRILLKAGKGPEEGVRFEHFVPVQLQLDSSCYAASSSSLGKPCCFRPTLPSCVAVVLYSS